MLAHVTEGAFVLSGPSPIRFAAQGKERGRSVAFVAWGGHSRGYAEFVAVDREWLPGRVATERVAQKVSAPSKKTFALVPESTEPATATFNPPAPFFGRGSFREDTGKLTGSLGVHFLGLTLHLTPSPLKGKLEVEEPL